MKALTLLNNLPTDEECILLITSAEATDTQDSVGPYASTKI